MIVWLGVVVFMSILCYNLLIYYKKYKMFRNSFKISFLHSLFNVRSNELSRISIAWFLRFFYRVGFVIGWTILVALFVAKFGISRLPYLLILNALFTVVGSFFYAALLDTFRREYVFLATVFASIFVLLSALFFSFGNDVLFFSFLIVAIAVCMNQLKILLSAYVEDMFDPLESERTFPLIEASDTFAGIVAGILASTLSFLPVEYFIYFWIFSLLMLFPLVVLHKMSDYEIVLIPKSMVKRRFYVGVWDKLKDGFSDARQFSYLKGLVFIVFFQWIIFNLLEYQYTVAVFDNISSVIVNAGNGFEHAFIHDLGVFFILFSVSALLIQLFVGSRILTSLGVIGTMILHVFVTFLSVVGLIFSFNLPTALFAKNNFMMTSILNTNAYHASYYVVDEGLRSSVREFLEGFVRPFGALMATVLLLVLKFFLSDAALVFCNSFLILAFVIFMFVVILKQKTLYTDLAVYDLLNSKDKSIRLNAIGVLGQGGHGAAVSVLKDVLLDENESVSLRLAVLKVFSELKNLSFKDAVLNCLKSSNADVRAAALDVLLDFDFDKSDLMSVLKSMYLNESDDLVLLKLIDLMFELDKDLSISILKSCLSSNDVKERIYAAIALFSFDSFSKECLDIIKKCLLSENITEKVYGVYAVGELLLEDYKSLCCEHVLSSHDLLKMHAHFAVLKFGDLNVLQDVVDLLLNFDFDIYDHFRILAKSLDVHTSSKFKNLLKKHVSVEIVNLVGESVEVLSDLDFDSLAKLRHLYFLIDEYDEIDLIDVIMRENL